MLDLMYVTIFLAFLALTIGFVAACDRLMPPELRSKP